MHSVHTANCQTWSEIHEGWKECEAHTLIEKYLVPTVLDTVVGSVETTITKQAKSPHRAYILRVYMR